MGPGPIKDDKTNGGFKLPITLDHELLIEFAELKLRFKSLLVGMEQNVFILAKIFSNDLVGLFNNDGLSKTPLRVMYRYKGAIYRFDTTIQQAVNFPARTFFLKYPAAVEKHCTPEKVRYKVNLPAQTMLGRDIVEISIDDISHNGCLCVINTSEQEEKSLYELIRIDRRIEIMVQFTNAEECCHLVGTIRNASQDINQIQLGVLFVKLKPAVKKRVADYIAFISKA
ncbi:MAG: PilZ domain-containing protein [Thermodesulfobacteriota bacterium]